MNEEKEKPKNPVCAVWWYDAAYSFQKEKPKNPPKPELTVGFVIESNDNFLNIATDVSYNKNTGEISPERGHLIPQKTIIKFKKINNLHD